MRLLIDNVISSFRTPILLKNIYCLRQASGKRRSRDMLGFTLSKSSRFGDAVKISWRAMGLVISSYRLALRLLNTSCVKIPHVLR